MQHELPAIPEDRETPDSPRRSRLAKGEWTLIVCILVMLCAVPAHFLGWEWLRAASFYVGSAALIGAFTNRIAIHALFDPWPRPGFSLPYTGIIQIERKRIENAIMSAVSQRLVTPEILAEELRESESLLRLRDEAVRTLREYAAKPQESDTTFELSARFAEAAREYSQTALNRALQNDGLLQALGGRMQALVSETLDKPESFRLIRDKFARHAGRLGKLGHATGVADYDEVTYRIVDGIKTEMAEVLGDPDRLRGFLTPWVNSLENKVGGGGNEEVWREFKDFGVQELHQGLNHLADRLEAWDIRSSRSLDEFIDYAVRRLDVRNMVGRALSRLSTEEVKQLVLKHSREHLGWLEVWGGVLGAVAGGFLWAVSGWLQ